MWNFHISRCDFDSVCICRFRVVLIMHSDFDLRVIKDSYLPVYQSPVDVSSVAIMRIKQEHEVVEEELNRFVESTFGITSDELKAIQSRVNNFKLKGLEIVYMNGITDYLYKNEIFLRVDSDAGKAYRNENLLKRGW